MSTLTPTPGVFTIMSHDLEHYGWHCPNPTGCGYESPFLSLDEEQTASFYDGHTTTCRARKQDQ